jgi:hypothetical protein
VGVKEPEQLVCPDCLPAERACRAAERDGIVRQWLRGELDDDAFHRYLVIMQCIEQLLAGQTDAAAPDDGALSRYISITLVAYRTAHQGEALTAAESCLRDAATAVRLYDAFQPQPQVVAPSKEPRLRTALDALHGVLCGTVDPTAIESRTRVARAIGVVQTLIGEIARDTSGMHLPVLLAAMVVGSAATGALALCGASFDDAAQIVPLANGVDRGALVDQAAAAAAEGLAATVQVARTVLSLGGSADACAAFERLLDPTADDAAIRQARLRFFREIAQQEGGQP